MFKTLFHHAIDTLLASPKLFELHQGKINHYEDIAAEFREALAGEGLTILDLGCSTGTCASRILDFRHVDYTGIDLHAGYIDNAARRFAGARFLTMDAQKLSFPDRQFDCVLVIGVLHHMDDTVARAAMQEAARVLKPEGRILIAEPLFTPGRWVSNLLNRLDRGRFIRNPDGYRELLTDLTLERERYFDLDVTFCKHRMLSFVARRA